ncbi:hypothetical protein [Salinicola halophilus]|uniref:hypothetical protein n=1 Tax=Salinicola halophilus TaxID=184065 RepID=UPI000DA1380B|nr:hypothetical protein [Salinicola halophilus]
MTALDALRSAWNDRSAAERRRLAVLLPIVVMLLAYWFIQSFADDHDRSTVSPPGETPPATARLVSQLPAIAPMSEARWQQAGDASGIALDEIRRSGQGWRLQGQVATRDDWRALTTWAAERGWWATEWRLARETDDSVVFETRFSATLEGDGEVTP